MPADHGRSSVRIFSDPPARLWRRLRCGSDGPHVFRWVLLSARRL